MSIEKRHIVAAAILAVVAVTGVRGCLRKA